MLNIIENGVADISYTVQHIDDGKISGEYIIKCKATRIDKNGFSYYEVFVRDYRIIMDAFRYLNIYMKSKADQTRQQAMAALKYLYSYCTLFAIDPKAMNKDDSSAFISFLLGQSVDSSEVSFQFNIVRSSSSANDYLSSIRAYLKHPGIKKHPLLERSGKKEHFRHLS